MARKNVIEWLSDLLSPVFDWIQVEVTSYCNAACLYCPNTVYRNAWVNRHMSISTFKRLLPAFAKTELVFLQGWGEPLLNPDFFAMAAMAKEAGCQVGTSTNGMLLDAEKITQLVECEVDVVSFSIVGTGEKNDDIRKETRLKKIVNTIELINQVKEKLKTTKPAIHLAYMLLYSSVKYNYSCHKFNIIKPTSLYAYIYNFKIY